MKTADNRFMVIAQILRAAVNTGETECILAAAVELEAIAGEGPSDGEMMEWVVENLIEKRSVTGGGVAVHWVDADGEDQWTKGKDTRDAIRNAMRAAAIEGASEATNASA